MAEIGTQIKRAASLLKEGKLVGMPTETVYGLAADAGNKDALARLFAAKGRPTNHPVIVHLASAEKLSDWVESIPTVAEELAKKFWPGPITMIFRKKPHVLYEVTGGQETVAIRVPQHPVALELLREFGGGLAAPSANRFGKLSPTRAEDVANGFGDEVSYVLDGGTCDVGIESTIIDLSSDTPRILRPGMISADDLEPFLHQTQRFSEHLHHSRLSADEDCGIRAPGTLKSHYSPHTPLKLVNGEELPDVLKELKEQNLKPAVLSFQPPMDAKQPGSEWIVADRDPLHYARHLYMNLRKLDTFSCDWIVVEQVPETDKWVGIRDRLKRASYRES